MFILLLIIVASAQDLSGNVLDNYSYLNAKAVRETIERGFGYISCMTCLNHGMLACINEAMAKADHAGISVGPGSGFQAPNKCLFGFSPNVEYVVSYCNVPLATLEKVNKELERRNFTVSFGLLSNPNISFSQLKAVNLRPTTMTISW